MKFSWFLAFRYLKPKRTFISIITVISVLGVALGVGVLIVVIAVMSGFEKRIKDDWLRVESPVYVRNDNRGWMKAQDTEKTKDEIFAERLKHVPESERPIVQTAYETNAEERTQIQQDLLKKYIETDLLWRVLLPKLRNFPGVKGASPYLEMQSMIQEAKEKQHSNLMVPQPPSDIPGPNDPEPPAQDSPGSEETPGVKANPANTDTPTALAALPSDQQVTEPDKPVASASQPKLPTNKESVVGLDRTRPLVPALIRGVDTGDAVHMDKLTRRFEELKDRRRPGHGEEDAQAVGEFDLGPESAVLSLDLVQKLKASFISVGITPVNVFGPKFINEGFDILQENTEAKDDPEKKKRIEEQDRDYPLPGELIITGIFNDDKMQSVGLVSLRTAQQLAGAGFDVDGFGLDIDDPYDAPVMAQKLMDSGILPEGWVVETWIDRHRQQFDAVANERGMMYIVLAFISIVAAFCIMNTMITMAVMKRREIGMMRALGAKISHIVGLFMTNGFIVGLVGTGLGYLIGRTVLHFRNELRQWINEKFGHQIFDSGIYGLWDIPAELRTVDQVIICGLAFVLCTLAAVPPAWIVGRMQPAQALRSDR